MKHFEGANSQVMKMSEDRLQYCNNLQYIHNILSLSVVFLFKNSSELLLAMLLCRQKNMSKIA